MIVMINRCKGVREALGMSREEFASLIGEPLAGVDSLENGDWMPSIGLALRCAMALRCDVNMLFQLKDDGQEPAPRPVEKLLLDIQAQLRKFDIVRHIE